VIHHAPEPDAGPSGSGTVVLELGPGAGALVLHTPDDMNGAEIEISLSPDGDHRTHSMVRPRHVAGSTQYAAVYPALPPGDYTIWRDRGTRLATVTVTGGAVATVRWDRYRGQQETHRDGNVAARPHPGMPARAES
jgi:hypothetical protein